MPGIQEHEKFVLSWCKEIKIKDNYWHECITEISLVILSVLKYVTAAYSPPEMVNSENKWKQCLYTGSLTWNGVSLTNQISH